MLHCLPCSDPANYDDRIMPTFTQDTTLLFCFGSCETDGTCPTPATPNNVTFAVDMNQYGGSTANGVFVNGAPLHGRFCFVAQLIACLHLELRHCRSTSPRSPRFQCCCMCCVCVSLSVLVLAHGIVDCPRFLSKARPAVVMAV